MSGERAARDRELFDASARTLHAKDLAPPSRAARRHRLLQTVGCLSHRHLGSVLEVGCGAGFAAAYLDGRYDRYVGLDHSRELIDLARRDHGGAKVSFEVADAAEYSTDLRFSVILMIGVLHHLEAPEQVLARLTTLLEPGGHLVANEPQPANPLVSLARRIRTGVDPDYSSEQEEIPRRRLARILSDAGLEQVRTVPQGLLSTPFAEVVMRPYWLAVPAARAACAVDRLLERAAAPLLVRLSWNLVALGRSPERRE